MGEEPEEKRTHDQNNTVLFPDWSHDTAVVAAQRSKLTLIRPLQLNRANEQ